MAASFLALRLPERLPRRCRRLLLPPLPPPLLLLLPLPLPLPPPPPPPLLLPLLLRGAGVEKGVLEASVYWWREPPAAVDEIKSLPCFSAEDGCG
ncbi:MAG: hypothetical protein VX463_02475 [Pseudomonadota bacterium]|nr:hypothetical protein [Pseudomonadota bacterium]